MGLFFNTPKAGGEGDPPPLWLPDVLTNSEDESYNASDMEPEAELIKGTGYADV